VRSTKAWDFPDNGVYFIQNSTAKIFSTMYEKKTMNAYFEIDLYFPDVEKLLEKEKQMYH